MPTKKEYTRTVIMGLLGSNTELGLNQIMMQLKKDHKAMKNRTEVRKVLVEMRKKEEIKQDMDSRKYSITAHGKSQLSISGLASQVQSCKFLVTGIMSESSPNTGDFKQFPTSRYLLISPSESKKGKKFNIDLSGFGNRIEKRQLDLTLDDIKLIADRRGLTWSGESDFESMKEDALEALANEMETVILVEVLEPSVLLNELRRKKMLEQNKCPECGSDFFTDSETGKNVCHKCGFESDEGMFDRRRPLPNSHSNYLPK